MPKTKIADGLKKVENWTTGQELIEQGFCRLEELEQAFNSGYLEAYYEDQNGKEVRLIPPSILKKKHPKYNCRNVFFLWPENVRCFIDAKDFSLRKPKSGRNEKINIAESHGPIFDADIFFQINDKALIHVSRSSTIQMVLHRFLYPFELPEQILLFKPIDQKEEVVAHEQQAKEWFLWQIILNPRLFDYDYLKKEGFQKDTVITLYFKSRELMFYENQRLHDFHSTLKQAIKPGENHNKGSKPKQPAYCRTQAQFILEEFKYKNVKWSLKYEDSNIKGVDGKTTIDLKQIYEATAQLYKEYQPINELSSPVEVISYIREEISHLVAIAEEGYEYVGFEHNQANFLLPDRSTYIRRYFLPNPTELANKHYTTMMYGMKYKYCPTPSIYVFNTSGSISPDDLLAKKSIEKLRAICQELLTSDKILSEKLYAEMRGKGCTHLAACRALYPIHKSKIFRKKRETTDGTGMKNTINLGYNENTLDSAYRDYKDSWECGELEQPNIEYIKELRNRPL